MPILDSRSLRRQPSPCKHGRKRRRQHWHTQGILSPAEAYFAAGGAG